MAPGAATQPRENPTHLDFGIRSLALQPLSPSQHWLSQNTVLTGQQTLQAMTSLRKRRRIWLLKMDEIVGEWRMRRTHFSLTTEALDDKVLLEKLLSQLEKVGEDADDEEWVPSCV
ncbi:hypothetical protein B0H14DRAFT_2648103 [Mycena olivaceomarginata]|nr:hypothetical protein B0H14DRAFT_2648103 [Mycena olivaceomarginata]